MGKISSEPQKETTATHFSHPHPLKLVNYQQTLNSAASCPGCSLKPSGMIYSCTTCRFFLHKKCFEMPKKITHPFHKEHAFTLLTEPAYAEGLFNCDACGETGNGFSYHCKPCGIDLHILCAAMPLSSHMCSSCGFDAHLNCARRVPPVQPPVQIRNDMNFMAFQSQGPMPQQAATCSRSAPWPNQPQVVRPQFAAATPQPMQPNFMPNPMMNNAAVGVPAGGLAMPPAGFNRNSNEFAIQAIQQMIHNNHAMAQAMLAGGAGGIGGSFGGGLGGDRGTQQLMQLLSGLNHGGIGGGGIPGLNAFGGGGGGQDYLQSLMNGGVGGGGTDFLQSLLGGGGNGLDFLGGGGLIFSAEHLEALASEYPRLLRKETCLEIPSVLSFLPCNNLL
ncbi:UNVERIFIED_CONTAM: hypothetical protein Slati_0324900 [Sesamum latifolium]|uniref:DC1 domain-containing protein n=1 Tax=Sesamum latifolium TaxID=2727402 RepID=A0AAW2YF19_9LAMI